MISRNRHPGHALHQLLYAQIFGTDAFYRGNRAVQDVVTAVVGPRTFDRQHIQRFFDNAQHGVVARVVLADQAGVFLGNVVADRTEARVFLQILQRGRQIKRLIA